LDIILRLAQDFGNFIEMNSRQPHGGGEMEVGLNLVGEYETNFQGV